MRAWQKRERTTGHFLALFLERKRERALLVLHIYIYVRDRESIRFLPHGFFELPGTVDPGSCAQVVGGGKVQKLRYRSISLIGLFDFFYFFCSTSFSLFRPAFPLQ